MIGICRLFRAAACSLFRLQACLLSSAHSTRALCCEIVTKSGGGSAAAAAAIYADCSDKRVCGRVGEKGKRRVQQSLVAAVESDLPEVWLSRIDGLFAKTATRKTGVDGSLVGGNVISSAETSPSGDAEAVLDKCQGGGPRAE